MRAVGTPGYCIYYYIVTSCHVSATPLAGTPPPSYFSRICGGGRTPQPRSVTVGLTHRLHTVPCTVSHPDPRSINHYYILQYSTRTGVSAVATRVCESGCGGV